MIAARSHKYFFRVTRIDVKYYEDGPRNHARFFRQSRNEIDMPGVQIVLIVLKVHYHARMRWVAMQNLWVV